MGHKIYKIIYFVYNFYGIFNFKFDGKKFKIYKLLNKRIKVIYLIFFMMKFLDQFSGFIMNPKMSMSLFSLNYLNYSSLIQRYILIYMVWVYLGKQKEIAKILTIFYSLKKFCDSKNFKINLKIIKLKIFLYLFNLFFFVIVQIKNTNFQNNSIIINDIVDLYIFSYLFSLFIFYYFILIHFELLLVNFQKIINDQIEVIHDNCEEFLNKFFEIQNIFKLMNDAFGKAILLYTIFQLIILTRIVSFKHEIVVLKF